MVVALLMIFNLTRVITSSTGIKELKSNETRIILIAEFMFFFDFTQRGCTCSGGENKIR